MNNYFDLDSINEEYDLIILGGGAAGMSAAIYSSRDFLSTLIIEKLGPGGQMATTSEIENYPGFESINGGDLSEKFFNQAVHFGTTFRYGECHKVELTGKEKLIYLKGRETPIKAKTVIIATGCQPKKLGVDGEDKFWGKNIGSCATCDGGFYKGKIVAAVGGGNAALEETAYLTRFADKVYLIHRRQEFRASKSNQQLIKENPKIELILDSVIKKINGENLVNSLDIENVVTKNVTNLKVDGLFVFVGQQPISDLFKSQLETDESGFLLVDETTKTKIPGVFVAGDIRTKEVRQIATAVADGVVAAKMAVKYLLEGTKNK